MIFVSIFSSEKNRLQFGVEIGNVSIFFHPFICRKKPEKFDVTFSFKRSLQNTRTNYATMNSVFGLGSEI